jgi:hypothetical protein
MENSINTVKIFTQILGKTITQITDNGCLFIFSDGSQFRMIHHQDCCEDVSVHSIAGDLDWLIGKPLIVAEEVSNTPTISEELLNADAYSCTWTFYKFGTNNGVVSFHWYGESNGYYSETPNCEFLPAGKDQSTAWNRKYGWDSAC